MNDLVYVGYLSSPFGLKGEVKVLSDSNHLDKIFKVGNKFYIDNKEYEIIKYHFHKNHLVTFKNLEDINKLDEILKKDVYISRSSLNLNDDEFLYIDLIGMKIIEDNKEIGVVEDLLYNKNTIFIKCGSLIIPLIEKYLEKVDTKGKMIYVKNSKELVL